MVNAIIKGIFWVITKLFNILTFPIIAVISALFPDLTQYFDFVSDFIALGLTYVRSILDLVLLDTTLMTYLFDYFIICNTIYYSILAIKLGINLYNKFKI